MWQLLCTVSPVAVSLQGHHGCLLWLLFHLCSHYYSCAIIRTHTCTCRTMNVQGHTSDLELHYTIYYNNIIYIYYYTLSQADKLYKCTIYYTNLVHMFLFRHELMNTFVESLSLNCLYTAMMLMPKCSCGLSTYISAI